MSRCSSPPMRFRRPSAIVMLAIRIQPSASVEPGEWTDPGQGPTGSWEFGRTKLAMAFRRRLALSWARTHHASSPGEPETTMVRRRGGTREMNFDFSDDLKQLREQARKFLRERCPSTAVRRMLEGPEPYDKALWKEMAAMGWIGAAIPEEYGGAGLGHLGLCVLAEELGRRWRRCRSPPRSISPPRRSWPAAATRRRRRWLPKLASGEAIGTLALAEGPARPMPRKLRTTLSRRRADRREAAGDRRRRGRLRHRRRAGRARRRRSSSST